MDLVGKRIFLSGGAGFIGTALIKRLIEKNEIIVYDTLQRNALKNTALLNHPNLKLIQGDVLDAEKIESAIGGSNVVIHLAAIAGVDTVMRSPINTMKINLIGVFNMMASSAKLDKLERFIYFSTSEVFGTHAYNVDESHETSLGSVGEARWTYAVSKLAGEHLCYSYYHEHKLPLVIIRPFNIYGPGQVGEGAIHVFISRVLNGEDLIIDGDGSQVRAWCFIEDIVDGIMLCLEKEQTIGHAFNIGDPKSTLTILDLAKRIIRISGAKSQIKFRERTSPDIQIRVPNIKKAQEMLGFQPKIDLDEGIQKTLDWYRQMQKKVG